MLHILTIHLHLNMLEKMYKPKEKGNQLYTSRIRNENIVN